VISRTPASLPVLDLPGRPANVDPAGYAPPG